MRSLLVVALPMAAVVLAACGGGGESGTAQIPMPFTSFGAVQSGQLVQAGGMSQTVSAITNPVLGSVNVTFTTVNAVDTAASRAQLTYGVLPAMTAFSFSTPLSSVGFSGVNVQCISGTGACQSLNSATTAVVINPLDAPNPALAWNYQSFGYWLAIPSTNTAVVGAISFGNVTPVGGIPLTLGTTYRGLASGDYVDQFGPVFVHASQAVATVDFVARTIALSTNGTTRSPTNAATTVPAPALDITGVLTYTTGSTQFSGTVTTPGGIVAGVSVPAMIGTATGRFYGPTSQEIGGVFTLKGSGPQTMVGSFGGKP